MTKLVHFRFLIIFVLLMYVIFIEVCTCKFSEILRTMISDSVRCLSFYFWQGVLDMSPHRPIKMTPFLSSILSLCTDPAVVAGVSAAILVVCVVVCCVVLCMCMICCRGRKSTQGNYTIGKPGMARVCMYCILFVFMLRGAFVLFF